MTDQDVDVDNLPKPILDALSGMIFADDHQVTDLLVRKRPLQTARIETHTPRELVQYIGGDMAVIHVLISAVLNPEVLP